MGEVGIVRKNDLINIFCEKELLIRNYCLYLLEVCEILDPSSFSK